MPNAAIWGAGNIANTHAQALKANGIPVLAVVDRTAEHAQAFAKQWDIPRYSDDAGLLLSPDIDCVHVCTPPNLHYQMVMRLLQHKKHVLCEKPLCFENAQAIELLQTAQKQQVVCAINFNVRFHMACQYARRLVQSSDFGRVLLIHGNYLQEFGAMPCPYSWRFDPALAGRMHAVTEIGSHWMDIAQYISGKKIVAVSAQFDNFHPVRHLGQNTLYAEPGAGRQEIRIDSEDAALLHLRFEDGAIGSVVLSELSAGRYNHLSLEITGQKQNLWWNSEENNRLCFAAKGGTICSKVFAFGNGFMDTFRCLIQEVYQAIRSGVPSAAPTEYPSFFDGAQNVCLCNAILQSAENNSCWVELASLPF